MHVCRSNKSCLKRIHSAVLVAVELGDHDGAGPTASLSTA